MPNKLSVWLNSPHTVKQRTNKQVVIAAFIKSLGDSVTRVLLQRRLDAMEERIARLESKGTYKLKL